MTEELILLTASFIAIVYSAGHLIRDKKVPFFTRLAMYGIGCLFMAQLYNITQLVVTGYIPGSANIGMLGEVGAFAFFFSSVYSQMDSLIDGGEKEYKVYRITAFVIAAAIFALYIPILFANVTKSRKLVYLILSVQFAATAYYNVKQLLIPDVAFGILEAIRGYNFIVPCMAILFSLRHIFRSYNMPAASLACSAALAILTVLILPILKRGTEKWRT